MASGHVRAEALGFTKSGRLVHFDGRETKPVSLKQSVEIVARFNIGLQQEVWDGETRHDAPWVKWLRMLAKAIR